jgi:hypothetical protein
MSGGEDSEQLKRLSGSAGVPPAKRRGRAIFRKSFSTITFALHAHYGRGARGPGQSLIGWVKVDAEDSLVLTNLRLFVECEVIGEGLLG